MAENYDVIILGGGPAGCALALSLARNGFSVALIERSRYDEPRIGETLPPAIKTLLVSLGVWEKFLGDCHVSSPEIQSAWGSETLNSIDYIYNPYGSGWHVDRARFDALLARCAQAQGACVYSGASVLSLVDNSHAGWQVEFASNGDRRRCHANFLVDATGRSSSFSRQRGARRLTLDRLVGIVRFFVPHSTGFTSDGSTLIEAVEDGWWYTAALPDKRRVVIYMTDSDLYATAVRRNRDCWLQQLGKTTHCRSKVASYLPVSTHTRVLAANSSRLDRVENKNWLALGDAAMAFDPLAGQGVYRALNSALQASRAIKGYWNGTDSALQDYAALIDKDFNNYLRMRRGFYTMEQRWPHTPFWQRRQVEVFAQIPKGSE